MSKSGTHVDDPCRKNRAEADLEHDKALMRLILASKPLSEKRQLLQAMLIQRVLGRLEVLEESERRRVNERLAAGGAER